MKGPSGEVLGHRERDVEATRAAYRAQPQDDTALQFLRGYFPGEDVSDKPFRTKPYKNPTQSHHSRNNVWAGSLLVRDCNLMIQSQAEPQMMKADHHLISN